MGRPYAKPTPSSVPSISYTAVPFSSDLAVELLEKGRVRLWLQAEKVTGNCKVDYVFNDVPLTQGEVSDQTLSHAMPGLRCECCSE